MLYHLTVVAQNTEVSNLTGATLKTYEYVEITDYIWGKIIIFSPKKYTQTKFYKNQQSSSTFSILPVILLIQSKNYVPQLLASLVSLCTETS